MTDVAEVLLQKIRALPPQRLAQVDDFVDFLKAREEQARKQQVDELCGNGSARHDRTATDTRGNPG